jgi:hypothetical protein
MASTTASFKGEKLISWSNYIEWLTNATLFLEINGYMPYIDGTESKPDKSLYYDSDTSKAYSPELAVRYFDKISEYDRYNKKALGALKSIISLDNTERFKDKTNAKDLWDAIKQTFGESSLELIGRYLNKIIEANYSSFKSMDEYTSTIQSSALYLKELKYEVPKPFLAWLLLKGLPSSFDSLISRKYEELAKDINNININKLISDLISEEARFSGDLEANRASNQPKGSYCTHCNKKNHIESRCFIKHPKLKEKFRKSNKKKSGNNNKTSDNDDKKEQSSKSVMAVLNTSLSSLDESLNSSKDPDVISAYNSTSTKIILDSGATEHYTPYKDWLLNYKDLNNKFIMVANGDKMPIIGIGDIPVLIGNKDVIIKNVNYVPNLKTTLISSKELTNKGWSIYFKGNKANLSHSDNKLFLKANWAFNAYYLNLTINWDKLEPLLYKVEPINTNNDIKDPNTSKDILDLYHSRFLHLSKDYLLKTIDHSNGLKHIKSSKDLDNCDSCYFGKFKQKIS